MRAESANTAQSEREKRTDPDRDAAGEKTPQFPAHNSIAPHNGFSHGDRNSPFDRGGFDADLFLLRNRTAVIKADDLFFHRPLLLVFILLQNTCIDQFVDQLLH